MNRRPIFTALLLLALTPASVFCQVSAPPPGLVQAPFLYVRLAGPGATRVTLYPGTPGERHHAGPVTVGLRPGYLYRVKFSDVAEWPGVEVYPTLEVRGSLALSPKLNAAQHPAPVTLDDQDLERIAAGAMITKVIYLEHPEKAFPVALQADQPVTLETRPGQDPLEMARQYGRPVLTVRLGQRTPTREELLCGSVPETIAFPGERGLGRPPVGPSLPWSSIPVYDPLLGPRPPEEECLKDGGDVGPRAAFGAEGKLQGIDPSDTVAEYVDSCGRRRIAVSNRICICVPRFGVIRAVLLPTGYDLVAGPRLAEGLVARELLRTRQPSLVAQQNEQLVGMIGRERPSETVATEGLIDISQLIQTAILLGRIEGREIIGTVGEKCPPPACPLVLKKWADKHEAKIGDVVTISLQYTNPGGQPISDVAVVDSLTGRLEYVPGSQKSDRAAVFTTQPNEAGSVKLRWEVRGQLLPGQSGLLRFQVKIR